MKLEVSSLDLTLAADIANIVLKGTGKMKPVKVSKGEADAVAKYVDTFGAAKN